MTPPIIVWFRQDLRLTDNPALNAAVRTGRPVIPIFIWDPKREGDWPAGAASRWWLHHSLAALSDSLRGRSSRLILASGDSVDLLSRLLRATGATTVHWNRRYEPAARTTEHEAGSALEKASVEVETFNSALLFEPESVRNKSGDPFQVFTPYWRHCLTLAVAEPEKRSTCPLVAPTRWPVSQSLSDLALLPKEVERVAPNALDDLETSRSTRFAEVWEPGEAGALKRLKRFLATRVESYGNDRDRPAIEGTSALSPHLHFGEIGPRQIWSAVKALSARTGVFPSSRGAQVYLTEIGWREFAHHLLWHFPQTPTEPLRESFASFPWVRDAKASRAWQRGLSGYPIVDAGLRQLWATGWMHNRVRMIVASFLVKHLRHSWREGAAWFWDTLVDADLANNTLGWQWSAGCGADAAPYFRIFNPTLQAAKFDPDGAYVRRWVPELAKVPNEHLHEPWNAPMDVLAEAGLVLGRDYPHPIVDHAEARASALAAFKEIGRTRP
ncbi:MAG TPA: deoxyribodipyrimidine photo-lyase [Candidatus Didemnitutus sp.]|nr:deoxyribodipyrimidine photo-lyase [Candidatus Didemnitutus sp.]